MCEINMKVDVTLCETEDCFYQIYPNPECHHIIENLSYCKHCVTVSKLLDMNDGTDTDRFERTLNSENDED